MALLHGTHLYKSCADFGADIYFSNNLHTHFSHSGHFEPTTIDLLITKNLEINSIAALTLFVLYPQEATNYMAAVNGNPYYGYKKDLGLCKALNTVLWSTWLKHC